MEHQVFIDDFLRQTKEDIPSRGKKLNGIESGLTGERALQPILKEMCEVVFRDVVIPSRRAGKSFASEMDYICVRNGNLVLIEVKNWYGHMVKTEDPSKVGVCFTNTNGRYVKNYRTNPKSSLGGFTKDFIVYLGGRPKKAEIKRFVVFLREDLIIDPEIDVSSSMTLCHLSDFKEKLIEQTEQQPKGPCVLPSVLPSWDYYYDNFDNRWYKAMLLNKEIIADGRSISTRDIHSIVLDKEDCRKASIRLRDGTEFSSTIDPRSIDVRCRTSIESRGIGAIILDQCFHN